MKRLLLLLVAVLALALVPATAGAAPKFELVVGSGSGVEPYDHVHVNAKDRGRGPEGHFFLNLTELAPVQFQVTCITVVGNVARVGGVVREKPFTGQFPVLLEITDNGEPGKGQDQHRWNFVTPETVAGPECGELENTPPPETITRGNYQVFGG